MKSAKNTEVSVAPKNALASVNMSVDEFFDEHVVTDAKDIMIPRILLMHGTSQLVGQQKAQQGDIIDSVSTEVLAKSGKPIEIIPIKQLDKEWVVEKFKMIGKQGKYEYEKSEPWDDSLKDQLEYQVNGEKYRRNARLSFYVLLARDALTNHLPYLISFQRTSYTAGRQIASFFSESLFAFKKGDKNAIPMAQVFDLCCYVKQGDLGAYYVMDCKRKRISSDDEIEKAKYWFTQLKTKNYKVHEEKIVDEEEGTSVSREF